MQVRIADPPGLKTSRHTADYSTAQCNYYNDYSQSNLKFYRVWNVNFLTRSRSSGAGSVSLPVDSLTWLGVWRLGGVGLGISE
jgi:hypothetical protein